MLDELRDSDSVVFELENNLIDKDKRREFLREFRRVLDTKIDEFIKQSEINVVTLPSIMGKRNDKRIFLELMMFFSEYLKGRLCISDEDADKLIKNIP